MTEREKILGRIQEALKTQAVRPGQLTGDPVAAVEVARFSLPSVGPTLDDWARQFAENATALRAEVHWVKSPEAALEKLLELKSAGNWQRVGAHNGRLVQDACSRLKVTVCRTDKGYDLQELERCDAGITECDALVAQTGSVLASSRSAGGRALSALPPHHVVLARRDQLVPDLPEAFALLRRKYHPDYPSFISFITGPSRTSAIGQTPVVGAHGPTRLSILCW